jgi:hypothetical protein
MGRALDEVDIEKIDTDQSGYSYFSAIFHALFVEAGDRGKDMAL